MTYKLNPEVRKITLPIILSFSDGSEDKKFKDGMSLVKAVFCKNYLIESLSAWKGSVVLTVRENDQINSIDWFGEKVAVMDFF